MAKKRPYVYRKYRRPETPAPTNGWVRSELAQLTGLRESVVHYYINRHIIRPIARRGTVSRYSRRDLMRLLGVMRLKKEDEETTLAQQKQKLDAMSDEQLERWLCEGAVPPAAAAALGFPTTVLSAQGMHQSAPTLLAIATTSASAADAATGDIGRTTVEHWQRVALLPGLELMVRSDAQDVARFAAQRICAEFVVR